MDLAKVRIHLHKPTKRNPYILVVAMHCNVGDHGAFKRTFRSKGIDPHWILERDMDAQEREEEAGRWRLHWYHYLSWEVLLKDEWKITQDPTWCSSIFTVSRLRGALVDILPELSSLGSTT